MDAVEEGGVCNKTKWDKNEIVCVWEKKELTVRRNNCNCIPCLESVSLCLHNVTVQTKFTGGTAFMVSDRPDSREF